MNLRIGQKIKALRLTSDLTQEELANRAQLTKGFISQLENEQSSIQIDTLADILEVLGISLSEFFSDTEGPQIVFSPGEKVLVDGSGASKFELLIPGSTNNLMDPVLIELKPGEKLSEKEPHPGEEFGYVLKGTLTLILNKKSYKVRSKHCFYFKADQANQILNKSDGVVTLLRVTSPPQM